MVLLSAQTTVKIPLKVLRHQRPIPLLNLLQVFLRERRKIFRVFHQASDRVGQAFRAALPEHILHLLRAKRFGNQPHIRRNHRHAAGHGFQHRVRRSLAERRADIQIDLVIIAGHLLVRNHPFVAVGCDQLHVISFADELIYGRFNHRVDALQVAHLPLAVTHPADADRSALHVFKAFQIFGLKERQIHAILRDGRGLEPDILALVIQLHQLFGRDGIRRDDGVFIREKLGGKKCFRTIQ